MPSDWLKEGVWCYEPPAEDVRERDYLSKILKPGMVFWDIGANAGLYSMVALSYGCNVLAVEPNFIPLARFVRNVNANREALVEKWPKQTIILLTQAVADTGGRYTFHLGNAHNKGSLGDPGGQGGGNVDIEVQTILLDELWEMFGHPDVVKVDGNGAEPLILASGRDLWECNKPPILICKFDSQHKGLPPSSDNFKMLPEFYNWYGLEGALEGERIETAKHTLGGHQNLIAIPEGV